MAIANSVRFCEVSSTSLSYGTTTNVARFFANLWANRLTEPHLSEHSLVEIQNKLDKLTRHLPSRFSGVISKIREELPVIFAPGYSLTLTHADLYEMNINVGAQTGGINGVVDWA